MHTKYTMIQMELNYTILLLAFSQAPCLRELLMTPQSNQSFSFTQLLNIPLCVYTLVYMMKPLLISIEVVLLSTQMQFVNLCSLLVLEDKELEDKV